MANRAMLGVVLGLLAIGGLSAAANPDDVVGVWTNEEKDARIEVFRCGDQHCGKIVWLQEPNYPEGSDEGTPGTPKLDRNNPNPELRKTPVLGLQIMHGFAHAGENVWKEGKIYDPKNGKTYSGKLTLVSPGRLDLRGYIGISLLGRTTVWTR